MAVNDAVVWHELECGRYTADLELWRALAAAAAGVGEGAGVGAGAGAGAGDGTKAGTGAAVLEVGAGSGRVALDLARGGHRVTALDLDDALLAALRERAGAVPVETVQADARTFDLGRVGFALCIAPMQTVQLLGGWSGRVAFMRRARAHLLRGGLLACAIVSELEPFDCAAGDLGPTPEVARVSDADYVSQAVRVSVGADTITIERERRVLRGGGTSPAPPQRDSVRLDRVSAAQLEREGREAGLAVVERRTIAETDEHAGGEVVVLRA